MDTIVRFDGAGSLHSSPTTAPPPQTSSTSTSKSKQKLKDKESGNPTGKRRCVSTACVACRRRKSKCDGNLPKCAACASVYLTECEYAPHTDHRRKGVYKKDVDNLKTKNSTLQTLIQAILNAEEDDVMDLVRQIRTCDNLEDLAATIEARDRGLPPETPDSPVYGEDAFDVPQFEAELSGKMGDLLLDGSVKFIGGTSNLIWMPDNSESRLSGLSPSTRLEVVKSQEEALLSWTTVTRDKDLILHFMNMYFCWHYAYFTTLAKQLFYRDFLAGKTSQYCSSFLVNVMLSLGCHFSSQQAARADPEDSSTTGNHFFAEAKRLMYENDELTNVKLCTVQALALMSVREAGCGRESKGWVYSGMAFRMALDLGLNVDAQPINESSRLTPEDVDARRITFWGCYLFDKCWSNYLGRQPQIQMANITVKKPDVFLSEDSELWSPYTDSGIIQAHSQPARTRAIALQISSLAEMSGDLLSSFYHPQLLDKPLSKQAELKKLTDLHTRLEAWRKDLPVEFEPKEGQLPQVLLMHMFFQLLYIHLYRPFLKYTKNTSPLPSHISPRKFCTQAAGAISKLFRLYKRTHGLRQICNIAIYIGHSACTIHLLNLPDKNAKRDIAHGVKHLEEMGEGWIAARRTIQILQTCAEKWKIEMPEEAEAVFARAKLRWGSNELTPPAASPDSLINLVHQMNQSQKTNLVTKSMLQHHQEPLQNARSRVQPSPTYFQTQQPLSAQGQPTSVTLHTAPGGLSTALAPSPSETNATRRSSGHMSLPPQSAADLSRNLHRIRPSTLLTQAQQDAWNAYQARLHGATAAAGGSTKTVGDQTADASVMFGGIDSLIEESQVWWFQDQAQLATGFDNWTGPSQDWSNMELDLSRLSYDGGTAMDHSVYPYDNGQYNNLRPGQHSRPIAVGNHVSGNRLQGLQRHSSDGDVYY